MSYISSNDNRLYVAPENAYGEVPAVSSGCRFPAVKLATRQTAARRHRRDKTGSRTFQGDPAGLRITSSYELLTYLTAWSDTSSPPAYGALIQAALGSAPVRFPGGTVAASSSATKIRLSLPHGLTPGTAISVDGEMRFVTGVVDATTVELNAPLTAEVAAGTPVSPTITYSPGRSLSSVSLFDYWSPETTVQRIVRGAAVDELRIKVNGDYHEMEFRGPACDVIDSASFTGGEGRLSAYPPEPALQWQDQTVIPGNLGQVWLGASSSRFFTLTDAELIIRNHLDSVVREFGARHLTSVVPGDREVSVNFELLASDDEQTKALYEASRQRSPIRAMFQLGDTAGHMLAIYLKALMPEAPEYDDAERRLAWRFSGCRAQGAGDDEIMLAFG